MAGPQSQSQSLRLSQLRALAQSHLSEIESEKAQEQAQLTQSEAEIQRYSKMSSYERKKLASSNTNKSQSDSINQQHPPAPTVQQDSGSMELNPQKKRFRPFPEILHRLQWDPTLNISEYVVGYLERFEGIKEMPATNWVRDFSDEEWIPMHRVRYVKRVRREEGAEEGPELGVVWDRDGRVDLFSPAEGDGEERKKDGEWDVRSLDGTSVSGGVLI